MQQAVVSLHAMHGPGGDCLPWGTGQAGCSWYTSIIGAIAVPGKGVGGGRGGVGGQRVKKGGWGAFGMWLYAVCQRQCQLMHA